MTEPSLWQTLQRNLRESLPADDFRTWVRPLRLISEDRDRIVLEAPNDRFVAILRESYLDAIVQTARACFHQSFQVEVSASQLALSDVPLGFRQPVVEPSNRNVPAEGRAGSDKAEGASVGSHGSDDPDSPHRVEARTKSLSRAALVAAVPQSGINPTTTEAHDRDTPSKDRRAGEPQDLHPTGSGQALRDSSPDRSAATPPTQRPVINQPRFNPKYRFSNFVVGDSNQFAAAAAHAVAESPGQSYNPLFLYGGVGLGKTHLLNAVGQEIQHQQPQLLVHYISAEQFLNELINSIRFDRMPAFRERYRNIDVLLIDDIQFLANKERTQEEFFHTFNALYTAEKQIILSSDASPKDIPTLEERLRSRFEWGLITDIQPPDLETKVAILRRKAALRRCDLDDEVALFIAKQVRSNVRELEGLLNRVMAFSSMTSRPLDLELAKETLKDILPQTDSRRNAAEIIRTVAKSYGLKVSEIKSRNKSQQISFPRQVAMYLCKELTDLSFPEIGKQFGDKHHSTVMHSVDKIKNLRQEDEELDRSIDRLVLQLR